MSKSRSRPALFSPIVLLAMLFLLALARPAMAENDAPPAEAEAALERRFNGVIAAARGGAAFYRRAFGRADALAGAKLTPDARFRIGSVSKTFTAALIHQLADEGALALDDKLSRHIQGVPNGDAISLRQLIEHRAGLADFNQHDWRRLLAPAPSMTATEIIALIAAKKPLAAPGKAFRYNNAGYVLLGLVIEKTTGLSYADALSARLLTPLGLHNTGAAARDALVEGLARGHGPKMKPDAFTYDYRAIMAAGGLYSSVDDLLAWCSAQERHGEMSAWRRGERFGETAFWHPGNTNSFSALLVVLPQSKSCYAVLSNEGRTKPMKEFMRVLPAHFFGANEEGSN